MYLYTANGEINEKKIIEGFEEKNIKNELCVVKGEEKICINLEKIKSILNQYDTIDDKVNERLENKTVFYSTDIGKYISGKSSITFTKTNVNECKHYCNNEIWCKSFSYNLKNGSCLLSNVTRVNNEFTTNYNMNYYEKLK